MAVDDEGNPFVGDPPAPGASAAAGAPKSEPDAFAAALAPLFAKALEYVQERERRHEKLDELENARRDRLAHAKIDLLGQAQTLVDKLTELAESAVTYVDTVLLASKKPATPVVE